MLAFLLIIVAGAAGTFVGIVTVIAKAERTTNRNQLLSNMGGSIALGAVVAVVPAGVIYLVTDNLVITVVAGFVSGFIAAWVIEEIDH